MTLYLVLPVRGGKRGMCLSIFAHFGVQHASGKYHIFCLWESYIFLSFARFREEIIL